MKKEEKIKIKATRTAYWYKKDQVIEVENYISFAWGGKEPHFEIRHGHGAIPVTDCIVLNGGELIPEYTLEEIMEKLGHEFKIKRV